MKVSSSLTDVNRSISVIRLLEKNVHYQLVNYILETCPETVRIADHQNVTSAMDIQVNDQTSRLI